MVTRCVLTVVCSCLSCRGRGAPARGSGYPSPSQRGTSVPAGGGVPQSRPDWGTYPRWDWVPLYCWDWGTSRKDLEPETRTWDQLLRYPPPEGTWDQRLGRNMGPETRKEHGTRYWSTPSPVDRQTDASENITTTHPLDAVGKTTGEEKGTEVTSDNSLENFEFNALGMDVQRPCREEISSFPNPKSRLKPTHLRTDTTACHRTRSLSFRECDYLNTGLRADYMQSDTECKGDYEKLGFRISRNLSAAAIIHSDWRKWNGLLTKYH